MGNVFYKSTFHNRGFRLAVELKAGRETSVSTYSSTIEGCLASILVFGPKGLVLGLSMALIPTETIHDFLEGKSTYYNIL